MLTFAERVDTYHDVVMRVPQYESVKQLRRLQAGWKSMPAN